MMCPGQDRREHKKRRRIMISIRLSRMCMRGLLAGGALCMAALWPVAAQVQSNQNVEHGQATHEVTVERGEVVYVSGNDLVVKMEDGEIRHFSNVPDSVTVLVDGKQLNVHQLQPGMKLERQTVRTTTPRVVTTVETVTGTVWRVNPPLAVTLTLENGENQTFKIPNGQKFMIDGKETDAFGLRKGMKVSAQRITEVPETVIAQEIKRTGSAPPPPPAPNPDVPILVATARPVAPAQTAPAEPTPKELPKTASDLPLIGLLGASLGVLSLLSMAIRRIASGPQKRPS